MRIATVGIALGMAVMIISVAIVVGFQDEIRKKVIGFGAHIQITNFGSGQGLSQPKLLLDQPFYPSIDTLNEVKSIHQFALKEGVIETDENIQGVILKGVSGDYDWDFFREHLDRGSIPRFYKDSLKQDILLSEYLANRLRIALGDKVTVYFQNAKGGMSQRNFILSGIYNTGLQELDEQFALIDIGQIRKINQWGVEANLKYIDCVDGKVLLKGLGFGGKKKIRLHWSKDSLRGEGPYSFCLLPGEEVYVVATETGTLADTAFFRYKGVDNQIYGCRCPDEGEFEITTSGGSGKYYTGGFEVMLNRYDDLGKLEPIIYEYLNYDLRTTTIHQKTPEIFNWLEMLDLNSIIIIALMVLISVINMTSALLILIMERTTMIGILRALGMSGFRVQKIFLYQASFIIFLGMTFGNIVGTGFCMLQSQYGFLKLDPENYYVSEVPILLNADHLILLNSGVFLVCVLMMILPTMAVNSVLPSRAIRFN